MTAPHQPITVNVQSGAGELLRIISTILLFGGAGAVAWSVAQGAHREIAATGMTLMIVTMAKLLYARGIIAVPTDGKGDNFTTTKSTVAEIAAEYKSWLAGTSMPALAAISIAYACGFLVLRAGVSAGFSVFSNLWVAGGAAAMVGALVVFPSLIPSILASLKRKGVVTAAPAPTVQTTVVAAPVVTAPAPAPAPVAQPAPAPAPIPTPTPAPRRVVRRVVKKENNNV